MPDDRNLGVERPTIDIAAAAGGWPDPWPNVAEIAAVLPTDKWTLVGGLMTQLHSIHHGLGIVRPTNDVDIVLHIETSRGVAAETASALRSLGYELRPSVDPRDNTAHHFFRGRRCAAPSTRASRSSPGPSPQSRCLARSGHSS